jgi:isoleucyl-tRNA synthetase
MLKKLDKFSLPELEEKVLEFWRTDKIFEKSLKKTAGKKKFVFYEGPPTANGRPGIHHVLARSFKDVIPRFKTMVGFFVPRRAGWDTHGLPVELEVEKKLGLKSKREIEKYGIAEFNKKCKESVWLYKDEWEKLTERMGFWLDMKDPYITYENSYIESVWNILKTVWDKKLLYKGHKVVPWCPRCGTGLSSHELALGYKEVEDTSVYLKFKLKPGQKFGKHETEDSAYILSWTTTPWTLPGNIALAVGNKISYTALRVAGARELYIVASELVESVFKEQEVEIVHEGIKGKDLLGLEYEPLFDVSVLRSKTSYRIYDAKFVTTTDGTGVVHTAVMYGEDDYNLGKEIGLPQVHTVDEQGKFVKDVRGLEGMFVKAKETEDKIIGYLKSKNLLLRPEPYRHEYPFCWRCNTPLLYYARDSWFISMSKLRTKLISENKKINWIPENVKEGRFGEWLRDVKDWAISRERYWGTPLPVWTCGKCGHQEFVGKIKELEIPRKNANRYILMRHGEAENNTKNVIDHDIKTSRYNLTLRGINQAERTAEKLKKADIDAIFTSDFPRTRQTAEIVARALEKKGVSIDARLREVDFGELNGHPASEHHKFFPYTMDEFTREIGGGENLTELRERLFDFVKEKEKEFSGKTILVVSHEYPIWMLASIFEAWGNREAVKERKKQGEDFIYHAETREYEFRDLPRNENGEGDLHRPYIDAVKLHCKKCGGKMERVKEVADVWFDSGGMPFAQSHWPLEKKMDYPADYISEAMDQTRGWFYTLLAIGVLMGKTSPFKNVICLGLVLDKNGQKMSKSKGNIVDPWETMKKHGVDSIRWYFYTVNPPGEPKKFDEAELTKASRQLFSLLYNSFVFFETYKAPGAGLDFGKPKNILDKWILSRLNETIASVTDGLNHYDVSEAGRAIGGFVDDLSRWHIRRSRRRFQPTRIAMQGVTGGRPEEDHKIASAVLGHVLLETSKLIAPFTPFFAEALFKSLSDDESVHLENWPKADKKSIDRKLSEAMDEVRLIASAVLAKRAELNIKVRQPLQTLTVKDAKLKSEKELMDILKDEVNVKEIKFDEKLKADFELDTKITHELKEEGILRELVRTIQDLRQDAKMKPQDTVELFVDGAEELRFIVSKYGELLKKEVKAKKIEFGKPPRFDAEFDTRIEEMPVWVGLKK